MLIKAPQVCLPCQVTHEFEIPMEESEFERAKRLWESGMFIQEAFPTLDANQRELLLTGTCQEAWDTMFPPDEEDE